MNCKAKLSVASSAVADGYTKSKAKNVWQIKKKNENEKKTNWKWENEPFCWSKMIAKNEISVSTAES